MIELLLLAALGSVGGTAYLILKNCGDAENQQPKLMGFPAAQVQGPRLQQLKRKGMLNPQEMATYIQFLEEKLGLEGNSQTFRVPHAPQPAPPAAVIRSVQGFPMVPQPSSPQVPHTDSPSVPQPVPHFEIDLPDDGPEAGEWDPIDEIFDTLEQNPGISKAQIAYQVFGLTREDKSGSPNSQWMKAMSQIEHCIALIEQTQANATQQKLQVLIGGKSA